MAGEGLAGQEVAGVRVTGTGSSSGTPDRATVVLAVSTLRSDAGSAVRDADACVRRVREALAPHGGAWPAATTALSLRGEDAGTREQGSRRTGYRARHALRVDVGDLDALPVVLADVLHAGGDDLGLERVDFSVVDEAALRARARDAAWADAWSRADQLAGLAGRTLGDVVGVVEESDGGGGSRPMRAMAASVAVEPGDVQATVSLVVQWSLR